jgi:hypothetical protein
MYAHQVIEDNKNRYADEQNIVNDMILYPIKSAQHFSVSNVHGLLQTMTKYDNKPVFYGGGLQDVRMPYKKIWVDWKENGTKFGLLANELDYDLIVLSTFLHDSMGRGWMLIPVLVWISIGKTLSENNKFLDIFPLEESKKLDSNLVSGGFLKHAEGKFDHNRIGEYAKTYTPVLNSVLLFLGCKNIGTEKNMPDEALNKSRIKKGKQPLFTYHTLVIKPVGKKQESIPKDLWHNRIHLARGHFKTYTEDNPMFGKITGRFWWQPHVRGQNKEGIVLKDYELKAA